MIFMISKIFLIFYLFFLISFFESLGDQSGEVGSASPPGGNLVDGLPPASSTVAAGSSLDVKKMLTYLKFWVLILSR